MASTAKTERAFLTRGTIITGLAAIVVASLEFDPLTGPLIVALIYAHEFGHVLAARWRGAEVKRAPLFIPGFGAFVMVKPTGRVWDEVFIAAGGPIVGGVAAVACLLAGLTWASPILFYSGTIGLYLNVFNLLPFTPLDGGRIVAKIGWVGVIPTLVVVILNLASPVLSIATPEHLALLPVVLAVPLAILSNLGTFLTTLMLLGLWSSYRTLWRGSPPRLSTRLAILGLYVVVICTLASSFLLIWEGDGLGYRRMVILPGVLPDRDTVFMWLLGLGALYVAVRYPWSVLEQLFATALELGLPVSRLIDTWENRPEKGRLLRRLASSHANVKNYQTALEYHRQALAVFDHVARRDPLDSYSVFVKGNCYWSIGYTLFRLGERHEACQAYRQSALSYEAVPEQSIHAQDARTNRARVLHGLAEIHHKLSRHRDAAANYQQAIAAATDLCEREPPIAAAYETRASASKGLGCLWTELGEYTQAFASFRDSVAGYEAYLQNKPDDPDARLNQARALTHLGDVYAELGDDAEAGASFVQALSTADAVTTSPQKAMWTGLVRGWTLRSLADLRATAGETDAASECYRRSRAAYEEALGRWTQEPELAEAIAYCLHSLAWLHGFAGERDVAAATYHEALTTYEAARNQDPHDLDRLKGFAEALRDFGEHASATSSPEADELLRRAIAAFDHVLQDAPDDLPALIGQGRALLALARYQAGCGHQEAALECYRDATVVFDRSLKVAPRRVVALVEKGRALTEQGRLCAAAPHAALAREHLVSALKAFDEALSTAPGHHAARGARQEAQYLLDTL